jgi:hypothetical protein
MLLVGLATLRRWRLVTVYRWILRVVATLSRRHLVGLAILRGRRLITVYRWILRVVATLWRRHLVGLAILRGRRLITVRRWIGIRRRGRIVTVCGRIIDIGHSIAVAVETTPITDFLDLREIDIGAVRRRYC